MVLVALIFQVPLMLQEELVEMTVVTLTIQEQGEVDLVVQSHFKVE